MGRRTVGDYVTLIRGKTYKGALVGKPGPALLGLGSIEPGGGFRTEKYDTYGGDCPQELMLVPGDLYVSLKGATKDGKMIGSVARVPPTVPSGRLTQDTVKLVFRDTNQTLNSYLYWILRTPQYRDYCAAHATGSAVVALSRQDFLSYPVPDPRSSSELIITVLDDLEQKIELNRRMNETLKSIAETIFKSWFVDFDPVRAKAEGRDPGLPQHLADLFPPSFEELEVGKVPKGWEMHPLGDLFALDKGLSYKGQYLGGSGAPMINLGCFLGRGRFAEQAIKNYSGDYQSRHIARPRDLLIANTDITQKREVLGSPAIVPPQDNLDEYIFTHHVFAARFQEGKELWKLFVYFILLQERFRERAMGFATGTTVLALPRDAVLDLRFPSPPAALVEAFEDITMPLLEREWVNNNESQSLSAVRDSLLPDLMPGDLRVPVEGAT